MKYQPEDSMGENLSYTGTAKAEYERKHNIKRGSDEWFKLWFAQTQLRRVKTQCPKQINTSYANTGIQSHRYKLS